MGRCPSWSARQVGGFASLCSALGRVGYRWWHLLECDIVRATSIRGRWSAPSRSIRGLLSQHSDVMCTTRTCRRALAHTWRVWPFSAESAPLRASGSFKTYCKSKTVPSAPCVRIGLVRLHFVSGFGTVLCRPWQVGRARRAGFNPGRACAVVGWCAV